MNLIKGTIYKWYRDNPILSGITIEIKENEVYQVVGNDEFAKQTLLEVLAQVDRNRLNALDYYIESSDIVYVPRKLTFYAWMTAAGLLSFHEKTREHFNKEGAIQWLRANSVPLRKPIMMMSVSEKKLLSIAIGLSMKAKLYVIDGLYTYDKTINEAIDNILASKFECTLVINEPRPIKKATKLISIKDHNEVKTEETQ